MHIYELRFPNLTLSLKVPGWLVTSQRRRLGSHRTLSGVPQDTGHPACSVQTFPKLQRALGKVAQSRPFREA